MLPPMHPAKPALTVEHSRQPSLEGSGRWRLSLSRDVLSPGGEFLPSSEDLKLALRYLEVSGTGKVREAQVQMLLELTFGEDAAPEKLAEIRGKCHVVDGRMDLGSVTSAVEGSFARSKEQEKEKEKEKDSADLSPTDHSSPSSSIGSRLPRHSMSRALVKSKRGCGSKFDCLAAYVEAFVRFDHNKDGMVSPEDLKHAVESSTHVKIGIEDCRVAVGRVDAQQIGGVTLLDFRHLMEQLDQLLAGAEDDQL